MPAPETLQHFELQLEMSIQMVEDEMTRLRSEQQADHVKEMAEALSDPINDHISPTVPCAPTGILLPPQPMPLAPELHGQENIDMETVLAQIRCSFAGRTLLGSGLVDHEALSQLM